MPISLLFCHAVPPVSRQSCHRYSLYMETDTSRCGTWVNTTHTCMIDAETLLPSCLCEPHECSRIVHCTDTYTVLGRSLTQRMFHRGSSTSSCAAQMTMMISSSHSHDKLIITSQLMVVGVPRGCKCKETKATVKYRHDEYHNPPYMAWIAVSENICIHDILGLNLAWDLCCMSCLSIRIPT